MASPDLFTIMMLVDSAFPIGNEAPCLIMGEQGGSITAEASKSH